MEAVAVKWLNLCKQPLPEGILVSLFLIDQFKFINFVILLIFDFWYKKC